MASWHRLERPDASAFTGAGPVYRFPAWFAAPPARVWESLVSDESVLAWGVGVRSLRWTTARPFGIGATREVVLPLGAMTLREEFFRWDEGRGYSFFVREANRRWFRSFAENYELAPDGDGTLFTWTIALEPAGWMAPAMRAGGPLNRAAFELLVKAGRKYFAKDG